MPARSVYQPVKMHTRFRSYLRELEVSQVELLHDGVPEYVGSREQPAPTRALLVRDRVCLEVHLVVEDMGVRDCRLAGNEGLADVGVVQDGTRELELGRLCDDILPVVDVTKSERAVSRERLGDSEVRKRLRQVMRGVAALLGEGTTGVRLCRIGGLGRRGSHGAELERHCQMGSCW